MKLRSKYFRNLAFAAVVAGALRFITAGALAATTEATPERPNTIVILADDAGWGDFGCYGQKDYKTPRIDQMAKEGVLFKNFYITSPICSPSRVSFLTGRHPARLGIHQAFWTPEHNHAVGMPDWLDVRLPTIPGIFKDAGYYTGHIGKWHLSTGPLSPKPIEYGYDEAEVNLGFGKQVDPLRIADRAVDFVKQNASKRFYLNVWTREPHQPYNPKPEIQSQFSHLDEKRQVYADALYQLDQLVGRILDELKAQGIDDKTLVVFASDNGPETWGDFKVEPGGGGLGKYYCKGETGGLRQRKYSLYEGGVRVPLIVRQPGRIPAGKVDDKSVISSCDICPTVTKLCGIEAPAGYETDGINVQEAFFGHPIDRTQPLCWEWRARLGRVTWPATAVRLGNWKWVSDFTLKRQELYDLASDPGESKNLASANPEKCREMEAIWKEWSSHNPDKPDPKLLLPTASPSKQAATP